MNQAKVVLPCPLINVHRAIDLKFECRAEAYTALGTSCHYSTQVQ